MSSAPFMQLYPADYLSDTLDLTTEQHGAYLLILMTMWQHDAKLPSDPAKLARIARMTPAKFKAVWSEISRFFTDDGGIITNARLLKEHKKARKKSEARAIAGKVKPWVDVIEIIYTPSSRNLSFYDKFCHSEKR